MDGRTLLIDRRRALAGLAAAGAAMILPVGRQVASAADLTDEGIFTFVLNLEYLEAEYYLRGTTGEGIGADDVGTDPGKVTGGAEVPFKNAALRQFAEEVA